MNDIEIAVSLIEELKKVVGALPYDGDASCQVLLPTKSGKHLRVGITDEDVGTGKIWFDYYEGFNGEIRKLEEN